MSMYGSTRARTCALMDIGKASGEVTRSSDPAWPDEGKLGFQRTVLIREETLRKREEYL